MMKSKIVKDTAVFNQRMTDKAWKEILQVYDEAAKRIEKDIGLMIARYGKNNALTTEQINQMMSSSECKRWRMSLQEYIDALKGVPGDTKLLLELNTLSTKSMISRKEELIAELHKEMIRIAQQQNIIMDKAVRNAVDVNYYRAAFDIQKQIGYGFSVARIDPKMIESIVTYPWATKTYSRAIWDDVNMMTEYLKKELSVGLSSGSSIQKMAKSINDRFDSGRYAAERLVRTETKHFETEANIEQYKKLNVKTLIFHKNKTSPHAHSTNCDCSHMDDTEVNIDEVVIGVNAPPLHPHCKCYMTAKVDVKMFKEYGIKPLHENEKFEQWKNTHVK